MTLTNQVQEVVTIAAPSISYAWSVSGHPVLTEKQTGLSRRLSVLPSTIKVSSSGPNIYVSIEGRMVRADGEMGYRHASHLYSDHGYSMKLAELPAWARDYLDYFRQEMTR